MAVALALSTAERAELATRLLVSLHDDAEPGFTDVEWEAAWTAECDRREAELDADPTLSLPADEVFRRVQASLDARIARHDEAA